MPAGLASSVAASWLDAICNATNYTAPAGFYAKLHTGDPGAAGTSNAAGETTRQSVSMASASGGTITNDAAASWVNVSTQEVYTHLSFWSAVTGGTFLASCALGSSVSVYVNNTFTIDVGDVDLAIVVVAS
jgi:hypothetical protein